VSGISAEVGNMELQSSHGHEIKAGAYATFLLPR